MSSLDIRIGHDKQPAPRVPANVPLYNLQTGKILTDSGGTPLVSAEDIVLASQSTSRNSSSVVFTDELPFNKERNFDLTGKNFQALNNSIYQIELTSPGNGYPLEGGLFTVTSGNLNAILSYEVDPDTTGISSLKILFGGSGYSSGSTLFTIASPGESARYRIIAVSTQISADEGKFLSELRSGNSIKLPTGFDNGAPAYETRRVFAITSDNIAWVTLPVTVQKAKNNLGIGFGKITRLGSIKVNPTLPISEQFPDFSVVSSSILGIPKAETQLSLFSNVSSYGLDEDAFLFYRRDSFNGDPFNWRTRRNRNYGDHYDSGFIESKEESAIVVRSYKTPWTFPYGPGPNAQPYPVSAQTTFCNFLKIGCLLYDWFKPGGPGYTFYNLTDGGTYASNFVPYTPNHFSTSGFVLSDEVSSQQPAPYYDARGNLINPFFDGEEIYRFDDWDSFNQIPLPNRQPIGTLLRYSVFDGTIHFNEDIGYIHTQNNKQDLVIIGSTSKTRTTIVSDMTFDRPDFFFYNMTSPLNIAYRSQRDFFNQIDTWTETWRDIRKGSFLLPSGAPLNAEFIDSNALVQQYLVDALGLTGTDRNVFNNTRPGYSSSGGRETRAYLVSKKSFRYQPGRISGYTFGVRASGDASTNAVRIEWGIANDTDELMFQISGASLSIIRRSVVPLSDSVMERNSLFPGNPANQIPREQSNPDPTFWDGDQIPVVIDSQNNETFTGLPNKQAFEVKIPRDNWNGDPLNGNGPSGWNWTAENVTMYKIEFGWYGAIGVRFYAYVPVDNGEARWVKLHTIVIENQLGRPCMGDPYYKFKYALLIDDMQEVRSPQFIYKYGTSCYIDGGDEGTIKVNAATSEFKIAPVQLVGGVSQSTTVIGLIPKTVIYNSIGVAIKNKQSIYPRELSLQANGLTEVALAKCVACPGYGHTYQSNIFSGYSGDERFLVNPSLITGGYDRSKLELLPLERFANGEIGSNVITLTGPTPNDPSSSFVTTPTRFLRVGDIVNPTENFGNVLFDGSDPPYITEIDLENNTITLNKQLSVNLTNYSLQIQPLFVGFRDEYAKVIAQRIYLTYVGSRLDFSGTTYSTFIDDVPATGFTETRMVTINTSLSGGDQAAEAFRYHIPRILPAFERVGDTGIRPTITEFPARLSQYKAVSGSTLPVVGKDNSLLFLLPNYGAPDQGSFSSGQYADWRIGITSLRPTKVEGDENITWRNSLGDIIPEFTDDYKLYAERFTENIVFDLEGYEVSEDDFGRVPPFTVDYRIPQPPGTNTGRCSYVRITVDDARAASAQQISGANLPNLSQQFLDAGLTFGETANDWYLKFIGAPPFDYDPSGAEIGFNPSDPNPIDPLDPNSIPNTGSGVRFTTNFISYQESQPDGSEITVYISKLSQKLYQPATGEATPLTIYYIPVNLETFRKLATKSFDYNPFPLFFFIEMRDGCRINGPIIKEVTQVENVYNPRWIGSSQITISNDNILVGPIGRTNLTTGDNESSPPNFSSPERLSSALVDTQSTSQLRPYEVIDKFYVGEETKTVDLRAIFDYQKETITPDLLNTTAYFFIATSQEGTSTEIAGTLNYIEQQ